MAVSVPFGKLKLGDFPGRNMPDHGLLVEPYGDAGTIAVQKRRKRSRRHVLNVSDPELFAMYMFVQGMTAADKRAVKGLDWVSSEETFDDAAASDAVEGVELYWRTMYVKRFGSPGPTPDAPPEWDPLTIGDDARRHATSGLPLMKAKLRKVEIVNEEDPLSLLGKFDGSDTFWLLLPPKPDEEMQGRLGSIRGKYFFAAKVDNSITVIELAEEMKPVGVAAHDASSIMMATMAVVFNYEPGRELTPIDPTMFQTGAA